MAIEGKDGVATPRRLRLGMVGGGRGAFIGGVHRMAARIDDRYEFVAGALSADPERARASGADLLLDPDRCYGSWQEMAEREAKRPDRIDVVAIVTPNHMHHGPAKAFLQAGFHVICDKPMTTSVEEAEDLARAVERSGKVFVLTHNYTGYPMIRQARDMVASGALGRVRVVQAEYPQDWLTTRIEADGQKQASWRTDPSRSGVGGCIGDIGTHAFNLAEFVTGLDCEAVAADLATFVEGRHLDDNVNMMLRFEGGARGMLWASQVAPGNENGLRLRVYGERGGLEWFQEQPDHLRFSAFGEPPRLITRGGAGSSAAAAHATRIPSGHPEGYLEGFAQIYRDAAELISSRMEGREPEGQATQVPGVREGVRGVRFIHAAVASSKAGAAWTGI